MAVHVLGGGMGHDVGAPLDGAAQHRRGEGVVHDERHAVARGPPPRSARCRAPASAGFAMVSPKTHFVLGRKAASSSSSVQCGSHERAFQAHAAHGVGEQVVGAAVDGRGGHHMIAGAGDVEHREEVRRLARGGEHGRRAAFQLRDLRRHGIVGGVRQARVEVAGLLQIEQAPHMLARVVLPRGVLVDGHLARLAVAGPPPALHAGCSNPLAHSGLLWVSHFFARPL